MHSASCRASPSRSTRARCIACASARSGGTDAGTRPHWWPSSCSTMASCSPQALTGRARSSREGLPGEAMMSESHRRHGASVRRGKPDGQGRGNDDSQRIHQWRRRAGRRGVRRLRSAAAARPCAAGRRSAAARGRGQRPPREDGRHARALRDSRSDGADGHARLRPHERCSWSAPDRIRAMDEQGIDVEALSINPYWYKAERDVAARLIKHAEREARRALRGAARPLRRLRHGGAAASRPRGRSSSSTASRSSACAALRSAAASTALEFADPKFHPFWAKAEELGVLIFIHPQGTPELGHAPARATAGSTTPSAIRSRPRSRSRT